MRRFILLCFGLTSIAITLSCSKDPVSSDKTGPVTFAQLAILDTTGNFVVRWSGWDRTEPFLTTEKILGEPFTDNNSNGVYDEGIDGFTISTDPARNQDLNHNGKYDGPDSEWTPGIPFDDIDGNGIPRNEGNGYLPGVPYCDFNHNGKRDGDPFWSELFYLKRYRSDTEGDFYDFHICDSTFSFHSDSGITYVISTGPFSPSWSPAQSFVLQGDTLKLGSIPLLFGDTIVPGTVQDSVVGVGSRLVFTRATATDATYNFFGMQTSGLVRVIVDVTDAEPINYLGSRVEIYFAPGKGPIGYVYRQSSQVQNQYFHFGERAPTLPIPMTR